MASDNFSTSNIWPNYSTANVAKAASKSTQTMGKDQFLSILMKQLQNQDPMQPMEDKEFIAQMAQFSSVEQLMNISNQLTTMSQSLGNVSGLIGKEISWMDGGTSGSTGQENTAPQLKSGVVDSIIVKDGVQYAAVGDSAIPITKIIEIKDVPKKEPTTPAVVEEPVNKPGEAPNSEKTGGTAQAGGESL
ncbi:flagellar hook capping FlgD N-terminal domain-containing protein [Paenibacillus pini]|uniref:Flagellar basal-body rod modification protein FlgD n=1 Tax=Paenibacillus pini JCM 16418 TaxID=1236976 RepID=W7Z5T8_9BACL|nr:flagellar hook capping FlgD N-terminal domain-containing protein [Paenibacillus pini]GAF09689.1 flagellar basal-body rod modification protein FlgD [Paenibacillus pini JCM 16418]